MRHGHQGNRPLIALALAALVALAAGSPAAAQSVASSEAYGYFRTVEGSSLLSSREPEETRDLEINLPILAGDAVQVGGGSRVEAVLADGSVVRLEAGSELVFDQLARSPDSPAATSTRLVLLAGELQIRVPDETAAATPVEIENANARVYLLRGGSYWIGVAGSSGTRLIVREGSAEVLTEQGSYLVQAGEELEVSDRYGVETRVARAGYERSIERWARDLEQAAYVADYGPVEKRLHYQAAPLARSGSWVRVDGRVAWRPRVRYGWRPYTDGYWFYTPSGLTWVASTSWGYVTSHYGTWDYLPAYGWCWFPGAVYSPAWVYWYWGPTHVAWVPYGYYARHYGPRYGWRFGFGHGYGLRFGVYGYAAGGWSVFADWTFCPLGYFGRRGGRYYYRSGNELAYSRRALAVPRGIITTDTRGLDRAVWTRPYEARRRLGEIHRSAFAKERHGAGGDLPDVTSFVARRQELPTNLQALVKPRTDRDQRPPLGQIDRAILRSPGETTAGRVSARSNDLTVQTKPAAASRTLARPGETFGERRQSTASRFETRPVRRPTAFERAPTTVYRSSGSDRTRLEGGKMPARPPSSSGSLSGASRPAGPSGFERTPTSVYSRPEGVTGSGGGRPPVFSRPPSSASSRPGEGIRGNDVRPGERPTVFERAPSPVYNRPTGSSRPGLERPEARTPTRLGGGAVIDRKPTYGRPPTLLGPSRAPATSPSVSPLTRRPVESPRAGVSRPSSPSPRVQSPPSRSLSPRVQSAPSRSSSPRAQSPPTRSSGSRVQSSASRSSSGSGSSDKASASRSSARKKND